MIQKLLIANRGEIARRVMVSAHAAGISCVAVYSDADAGAAHVAEADLAVRLPGNTPAETYLRIDALVEAARASGADAVHPGYGFLSENAEFAGAVLAAGLTWVGPPPKAIEAMGSKVLAKTIVSGAGVPVLDHLDPAAVTEADLPVLIKASAGGGGRGMRIVRELDGLSAALSAAEAEAESAFGDGTVFCEPYVEHGRHIEVQVLADAEGTVWALGERECSLQRRHQKVLEESPSPAVDPAMRDALCAAAVLATRAIDYVGAGTVEFLAAGDGRFFFLETNTRLQVEHPVTEAVTGLDLVREQLRIAEGGRLTGEPPAASGHAIEVRLYAEDPAQGWSPQSGPLHRFAVSGVDAEFGRLTGHGLRLDSGVRGGDTVSVFYDPMLAKLISWAPTRTEAARALARALATAEIHGPRTNRDLLVRVLTDADFLAGAATTSFVDGARLDGLARPLADRRAEECSALAAALADAARNRAGARVLAGIPGGWRNLASQPQRKSYLADSGEITVGYRPDRAEQVIDGVTVLAATPYRVELEIDGVRHPFRLARYGDLVCVDSPLGPVQLRALPRFAEPESVAERGSLLAPMPGAVAAVEVAEGAEVVAGQPILVLEAMKMRHTITAPEDGVLRSLRVSAGSQVEEGTVLAVVDV